MQNKNQKVKNVPATSFNITSILKILPDQFLETPVEPGGFLRRHGTPLNPSLVYPNLFPSNTDILPVLPPPDYVRGRVPRRLALQGHVLSLPDGHGGQALARDTGRH